MDRRQIDEEDPVFELTDQAPRDGRREPVLPMAGGPIRVMSGVVRSSRCRTAWMSCCRPTSGVESEGRPYTRAEAPPLLAGLDCCARWGHLLVIPAPVEAW